MAYTPLKLNTGMAASPGFGDVYRNFSGQSGNNDSAADWTGRLANEAKRKSMGAGIFANNAAAWDAYNSGNVQGFQDALGAPQDTYDPMYRSTHTSQDAAADAAGMEQFNTWAANQKAQGLQTNGGVGGYSQNWSAGVGGPKFSGVTGGASTLPQDGIKKPLAASRPVQPPAAQTALSGTSTPEPVFSIGGSTPQPLPPAQNTTLPVGGSNVVASGSGLGTGMAAPIAQSTPVSTPVDNPSQDDPWAWQSWAAKQDPGTYGWNTLNGAFDATSGSSQSGPAWWGADLAGYQQGDDPHAEMTPEQRKMLSDAGYTYQTARGPGYANLWQVVGPDGKVIDKGGFNKTQSLHGEDYAMFASVAAPAIAPYISGAYGSAGLAAGSAGNAAATGATMGGAIGGMQTGTLSGAAQGAALGGLGGYASNQLFSGAAVPSGDFQDFSQWQAGDMASPNLTQLPGIDGMDVNFPKVNDKPLPELQQSGNFQDPAAWQANDQFPKFGGVQDYPAQSPAFPEQTVNVSGTKLSPTPSVNSSGYVPPMTIPQQASTPMFSMVGTPPAATPNNPSAPSVGNFLTQNPQLTAGLAAAGLGALQGSPNPPAPPSTPGTGSGSNPQLTQALQQQMFGNVPGLKTTAGDPNQFYQSASDAAYRNQTRYLDPQVAQQQKALEARLSEQGFVPGTPGYNQAMQNFMDANARAYAQARDTATLQGFQVGDTNFDNSLANTELNNSASNSWLNQIIAMRNQPINERNAIMTGDQIQYNNQLDQYNAQQQTRNSNNQLIGQLATAIGMYFSDARLKDDITPIGQTPGGLGIYSYTIFGRREIGVIAQEVRAKQPHAVAVDPDSGFLMVDYGRIA